jgi:enamine deaminase RidA (YjgF/YER057c/UK114 family)
VQECGVEYSHVVRTWIYLRRILDWYGEFNRLRTARYDDWLPAGRDGSRTFPASTGIQGHSGTEECLMELLALDAAEGSQVKARPVLASGRQGNPLGYGVSFSRAMALELDGLTTLFVSGTASLDRQGCTLHRDQPEQQYLESLLGLAAVLESQGGSLDDVCSATLFCKNADVYRSCLEVSKLLQLPELPVVPVLADVCRADLLLELEAVAVL